MQVLSPEESKKIATKFLKHLDLYNKEKVEKYFSKKPLILRIPIINLFAVLLFKKYRGYSSPIFTFSWPLTQKQAQIYEDSLIFGTGGEYNILFDKKFFEALKKTFRQYNIAHLYGASDLWDERKEYREKLDKRILFFPVEEINRKPQPIYLIGKTVLLSNTYIFSEDFSVLFFLHSGYLVKLFASKKFISNFKFNYPDFIKYLDTDEISRLKRGEKLKPF